MSRRSVDESRAVEDDHTILVGNSGAKSCDGLVPTHLEDLRLGRDGVAWSNRSLEAPVRVEKNAPRPGQVVSHESVEEPGCHPSLNDYPPECGSGGRL